MNVDTGELRALTDEIAALSRKVSTLTGRITVNRHYVNRLADQVERLNILVGEDVGPLLRIVVRLADESLPAPRRRDASSLRKRERHLRAVEDPQ
jgi:hypothetical protein